jgi:RNA polymerase sigma-70 factor (ECF subfamily)
MQRIFSRAAPQAVAACCLRWVTRIMMRVTRITEANGIATLRVEGRLTQQTIQELQNACQAVASMPEAMRLDVSGVQFLDAAGIGLLHELERRGMRLVGCSGFVGELLRERDRTPAQSRAAGSSQPEDEGGLVARLRGGDAEAFETMVRDYGGRMLAAARRLVGTEEDARDAVQEAFLAAFKSIHSFAGAARLSTWLHRIVVNAALMKLRSRRRRREDSIEDLLPRFRDDGCWVEPPAQWDMASDGLLERRETRTAVCRAIERLPASYRTVLMLRDIEELDTDETATALGTTRNAVKIRLHRARQALKTLLDREFLGTGLADGAACGPGARVCAS